MTLIYVRRVELSICGTNHSQPQESSEYLSFFILKYIKKYSKVVDYQQESLG